MAKRRVEKRAASCCARVLGALFGVVFAYGALGPTDASAQGVGAELITDLGLSNLGVEGVTSITHAPGRPDDLFLGILDGRIMRVDLTDNSVSTFATIPDIDQTNPTGMFGMQGLTFDPNFALNGQFYVHIADDRDPSPGVHHRTYIRRYGFLNQLSDSPTLGGRVDLLSIDQPQSDHNGGFVGFQPGDNETLWIAIGDGGNNDGNPDPTRTGQDPTDLRGSILRIDVSGDDFPGDPNRNYAIPANNPFADGVGGAPEVWSYGIRSPWGASFDRQTGDFIFGDVGQVTREEVNFLRADAAGGQNYGWRVMEGVDAAPFAQDPGDLPAGDPSFTAPVYDYGHTGRYGSGDSQPLTGRSVTGGYVYRGPIEELQGKYIFGDWSARQVWAMEIDRDANGGLGGVVPGSVLDLVDTFNRGDVYGNSGGFADGVTAFGEDVEGNLYFSELDGTLYRVCATCGVGLPDPDPDPDPVDPTGPLEPLPALRDDFDSNFNYQAGGVPGGGIWSDTHNSGFGDSFDANSTASSMLTIGMEPVGWQGGGEDTGPFLFREVDASEFMEVRVKISSQSQGFWSSAGVLVRVAGDVDDDVTNDNFLSAHSFRTGSEEEPSGSLQTSNVIAGAEAETNDGLTVEDVSFIRLVNHGEGDFEVFSSADGATWVSRQEINNEELASGMLEVGLWAGNYNGGSSEGVTQFDWAEIILGVAAGDYNEDGVIDAADYTLWRDTLGTSVDPWAGADGNGDGQVTAEDYEVWKENYGVVIDSGASAQLYDPAPEPAALTLVLVAGLLAGGGRKAGRRQRTEKIDGAPSAG